MDYFEAVTIQFRRCLDARDFHLARDLLLALGCVNVPSRRAYDLLANLPHAVEQGGQEIAILRRVLEAWKEANSIADAEEPAFKALCQLFDALGSERDPRAETHAALLDRAMKHVKELEHEVAKLPADGRRRLFVRWVERLRHITASLYERAGLRLEASIIRELPDFGPRAGSHVDASRSCPDAISRSSLRTLEKILRAPHPSARKERGLTTRTAHEALLSAARRACEPALDISWFAELSSELIMACGVDAEELDQQVEEIRRERAQAGS